MEGEDSNRILYLLIFMSFTSSMSGSMGSIFPLYVTDELGASKLLLGTILAITSACSIILRVPLGVLADRIGRWRILSMSLLVSALRDVFYVLAPTYVWLYPIGIFSSVAAASHWQTANAVASNLARNPSERGKIMGKYNMSFAFAFIFSPLLISLLLGFLNYRQIFLVLSLFSFSGLAVSLAGSSSYASYVKRMGYDKVERERRNVKGSLSNVVKSRNLVAMYLTIPMFYFVAMGVFNTLFSVYAKNVLLFSPSFISLLFSLRGLSDAFIRIPAGHISDRLGRKRPLMLGLSLMSAAILCFSVSDLPIIVLGFIIYGIGFAFRLVSMSALVGDSVPREDVGLAMAILFATSDAGNSLGSLFAGAASMFLPTPLIFQIAALMLLVATPVLSIIREYPH